MIRFVLFLALCLALTGSDVQAQNFRLQIGAYNDTMPRAHFTDLGLMNVMMARDGSGLYKYFVGSFETREEAEAAHAQLKAKGFAGSFIIDLEEQRALSPEGCAYANNAPTKYIEDKATKTSARNIFFEFGKATLDATAKEEMNRAFDMLKENPKLILKIYGYTDGVGDAEANLKLANERSRSARNYLLNRGIRAERMFIKLYGEADPLMDNKDLDGKDLPENQKWNRRVLLVLTENKDSK